LHTTEGTGSIGLNRVIAKHHSLTISGLYQNIKVKNEPSHFISETLPATDGSIFDRKQFAGVQLSYAYYKVNDEIVPTKGFGFSLNGSRTHNLSQTERSFNRYWTILGFYIPISKAFSIATRNGLFTVNGEPEFYQYNWLGGGQNLRGFNRQRFYGKTSFYNNNELRWIPNIRSYFFNGKIGLIAFLDEGRVWMPDQSSDKWHVGYGGGLLISPFNKIAATIYYGMSEEDKRIHLRVSRFF
jgi:outer membrane translocation and assembly module TamA